MNEENNTNLEQSSEEEFQNEPLTNSDAMSGVITSPSETFETIVNSPKKNYWIIPVLISIVVGLASTFLFMQDAELVGRTMAKQKEKMMEKFEEDMKDGKMTQEQVDQAMESMNPKGIFFKILGYGGSAVGPFIVLLLLSVIYLIALKIIKAETDFSNILNVVGLALLIGAIGNLISIVISILKGNMSTIGPSLIMSESSVGEKMYALLTKIDVFSIWFYTVIAIGLSKVGRTSVTKTATVVFGIWIVYILVSSLAF